MYAVNPSVFKHSRPCQDCGQMFTGHFNRRYCDNCPPSHERNYANPGRPKHERAQWCAACGVKLERASRAHNAIYCLPCGASSKSIARARMRADGRMDYNEAARLVTNYAVRVGFLPMPELYACVDCGAPAICYEHRDYNKPLDVEPVCRACNGRRGPGIPMKPKHVRSI